MLCLMSSSHPDPSDVGAQSYNRRGKRKADSDSETEEFEETMPRVGPRPFKRSAPGDATFDDVAAERSAGMADREKLLGSSWFNPSGTSIGRDRNAPLGGLGSRDPFVGDGLSLDPMAYNLFSSSIREPTLASLLARPDTAAAMFPSTLGGNTGLSSGGGRLYPELASLGMNTDPYRMDNLDRSTSMPGRDLLLARQRTPHQYNHSISSPSGISRMPESKESSPISFPTIGGTRFDNKATRRPSYTSYEQSMNQAEAILNRQRYADAISALRTTTSSTTAQQPRTLQELLASPTQQSMVAAASRSNTASPYRQHHHHNIPTAAAAAAASATSASASYPSSMWQPSTSENPSLADLLSRRRSSLSAAFSNTANFSTMMNDVLPPSRRLSLPPRLFPSERSSMEQAMAFGGSHLQQAHQQQQQQQQQYHHHQHHLSPYTSAAAASSLSSVALEVEALASSMAQRGLALRQSLGTTIPLDLPVSLSLPEDSQVLSELQVFIRQQIEVFRASEEDTFTHKRGRNKPVTVGQVGIRCRHCAHLPIRARQVGSTYFPSSLMGIYQVAQNMAKFHLQTGVCSEIPTATQRHLDSLIATKKASVTSGVGRHYWAESAKSIGLLDTDDSGIRFIRDL